MSRGWVLTDAGQTKLKVCVSELIDTEQLTKGNAAQLTLFIGGLVSESTIRNMLEGINVHRASIETLFQRLNLDLEPHDLQRGSEDSPPPPPPPPLKPNNIPFSGAKEFIGREVAIDQLHNALHQSVSQPRPVALTGMGGVGKTELAIQYGIRCASSYSGGICWVFARRIDAPDNATIPIQIASFAQTRLGLKIPDHITTSHERLHYCFEKWPQGDVLLIFDDVDHYYNDLVAPDYLPKALRFKILLTTRVELGAPVERVAIDVLDRQSSLALLSAIVNDERTQDGDTADSLCEFLGDLPLGVELAGRYLAVDPKITISSLLQELESRVPSRKVPQHYIFRGSSQENPEWALTARRGLEAAFDLTWEKLDSMAQLLAKLLGRLESGPIRWRTLEAMRQTLAEEYPEEGEYNPEELQASRVKLMLFNLIKPYDSRSYRLHPLTREFFRSKTTDDEYQRYAGAG